MSNGQRPVAPPQAAGTYPQPGYPQGVPVRPPNPSALARKALAWGIAGWVVSVLTIVGAAALEHTARAMRDASGLGWIGRPNGDPPPSHRPDHHGFRRWD